ncbi:MAG: hypothetical protein K9L22_02540 [Methylococcaceae bacterium]|nr:hypothetical protein [Methylococcaceae bacterium]
MRRIKWEYMLTALFLILSAIFLLLIAVQINLGKNYRAQKLDELHNVPSADFNMRAIPSYQFSGKTLDDYPDIVQRPLFFKGRKPILIDDTEEALTDEAPKVLDNISIDLVGIINTPEGVFALFQDPKAKSHEDKFKRLALGDELNGWLLKDIQYDRVIIVSGTENKELLLSKPRIANPVKEKQRRSNPFNQTTKK